MRNKISLFLVLPLIAAGTSCAPAYIPNVANTPMFSNKGELQAAIYTGSSGIDPQLAYAVTDHFGIMANGSFRDTKDDEDYHSRHNLIEVGGGYFTSIGYNARFEAFGGYGFGSLQSEYENELWSDYADVNHNKFFIQPGFGITSKVFDAGLASRLVIMNMTQDDASRTGVFLEPVLTARLGFRNLRFISQMGVSFQLNEDAAPVNYQPLIFSLGLQLNLFRDY